MSACMSGTRGSGVLSSTGDMLVKRCWWRCVTCVCVWLGAGVGGEGGWGLGPGSKRWGGIICM